MRSGEDALIQRYFAPIAGKAGLGLKDDAARLKPPPACELVLTADALVAGVHFFPEDPPRAIARKALRVNLSDLAAKGADPLGFLLTLAMPRDVSGVFLSGFSRGLNEDAKTYHCPLLGGDTVSTPGPLTISITAIGSVPARAMVRRAGAQAGDLIFVTGTIGDAALGLSLRLGQPLAARLSSAERAHLLSRYLLPRPRNGLANAFRRFASAAMDVSDGLGGDLAKLCAVSGVGCGINAEAVPLSAAAAKILKAEPARLQQVLTGGDDYEILGSVSPANWKNLRKASERAGISVTLIGEIQSRRAGITFRRSDGAIVDISLSGYSHFHSSRPA